MEKNLASDAEVQISFDDQQKINQFSRFHSKMEEYKDEIKALERTIQNITDATDTIMLEDQEIVPYQVGEIFVDLPQEEANKMLEEAMEKANADKKQFEDRCSELDDQLKSLKTALYAKFGTNINLEAE